MKVTLRLSFLRETLLIQNHIDCMETKLQFSCANYKNDSYQLINFSKQTGAEFGQAQPSQAKKL